MHSHSFQDEELKIHGYVNDSPGQVVEGWTILRYPMGLRNKGLITQKFDVHSHSFQDSQLKLHRHVSDSSGQTVQRLAILPYPGGVRNTGLITQNT